MKRLAFNGGEISPAMALRSDMDVYPRSCSLLDNFDVHATGDISRRKGFATVANAITDPTSPELGSILIPYVYSDDKVFLVEASTSSLTVYNAADNSQVASFSGVDKWYCPNLHRVTWQQINSLLLLCTPSQCVKQLKMDADGNWSLLNFSFKCPPWETTSLREREILLSPHNGKGYIISFDPAESPLQSSFNVNDYLRASYYIPQQNAQVSDSDLNGIRLLKDGGYLDESSSFNVGDTIALKSSFLKYYVCVSEFDASRDFVAGCNMPENYMSESEPRFIEAEDSSGFDAIPAIYQLAATTDYKKGDKIKIKHSYWLLFTCVRPFNGSADFITGKRLPSDYPSHFLTGIPIGNALPCKGAWKFHCSGTWYGAYEVRRCYDSPELLALWETLGESFSPIGAPVNTLLSGDESDEECYLRLFITKSRCLADDDISSGLPAESCQNALIVSSFKHDMLLSPMRITGESFSFIFKDISPVKAPLESPFATNDWSWCAFNSRFGYPALACVHESRLIFAATKAQPQTIWMSRTDDLNNFTTGKLDTSALNLTMSTTTQADICWMLSRGEVIMLGTEDAEWIIDSGGKGITPTSARIVNHGRVGSAHIPAVQAIDRVLYIERGSGRLYQYGYDWNTNAYTSTDLTVFADHIAAQAGGIISGTMQRKPYPRAIFVLADGTLALMTYNSHQQVHAWHRYTTNGSIESVCALPNGTQSDKLYAIVSRKGTRYLECLSEDSPYADGNGYEYTSTVSTTALWPPDADEHKTHTATLYAYVTTPTPAGYLGVRLAEHADYAPLNIAGNLKLGWNKLLSNSSWTDRPHFSLFVNGPAPFELLSLQL
ncbi:MAG: hypothetical protein IJN29_01050 [Akkermansia sp.]|nr:hypothetical protein [Akkermansia sp.]